MSEMDVLKARAVYVLIKKGHFQSRGSRIDWFLHHLDTKVTTTALTDIDESCETAIVSAMPYESHGNWEPETSRNFEYLITASSEIIFISEAIQVVYCLDISPSICTIDSATDRVIVDELLEVVQKSVTCLISRFHIPGTDDSFYPDVYVTVICHTPFYTFPAQRVLLQGWKVTSQNIHDFINKLRIQLHFMENAVAQLCIALRSDAQKSNISLLENPNINSTYYGQKSLIPVEDFVKMSAPGSCFVNLLQYGMLALNLLPAINFQSIILVTDGLITVSEGEMIDCLVRTLQNAEISCSFLHVASHYDLNQGLGYVSCAEQMNLIAMTTCGIYYRPSGRPHVEHDQSNNVYSRNLLMRSFTKKSLTTDLCLPQLRHCGNSYFHYGTSMSQLFVRKYLENDLNLALNVLLESRIGEGFFIRDAKTIGGRLVVNLVLPWTNRVYIDYIISCPWPLVSPTTTHYAIYIKAPYELLHDICCKRLSIKSPHRQNMFQRLVNILKSIAQSDSTLSQMEIFTNASNSYFIPENVRNGMPLYYLPPKSNVPVRVSSDVVYTQFAQNWRALCCHDSYIWRTCFRTEQIRMLLHHDEPVGVNAFNNQHFSLRRNKNICCKQSTNKILNFVKSKASFVLIENYSYIKFLSPTETEIGKQTFYVMRISLKSEFCIICFAFLNNIPAKIRLKVLKDFKMEINKLCVPKLYKETREMAMMSNSRAIPYYRTNTNTQVKCCILLDKPLEKIIIRYESCPRVFDTIVFPDGSEPCNSAGSTVESGLATTLCRYLIHKRCIWSANATPSLSMPSNVLDCVINTLIKIRLQEGFNFAYSKDGVINMVIEIPISTPPSSGQEVPETETQRCLIQYILFPPLLKYIQRFEYSENKIANNADDSRTNKMTGDTKNATVQNETVIENVEACIVTEYWIEPQAGTVAKCLTPINYMKTLANHQLPEAFTNTDRKCISTLFTFEYLRTTQGKAVDSVPPTNRNEPYSSCKHMTGEQLSTRARICNVPFAYSIPNLLRNSRSHYVQFTMLIEDIYKPPAKGPNHILLDYILSYFKTTYEKEIGLKKSDSNFFTEFVKELEPKKSGTSRKSRAMKNAQAEEPSYASALDWNVLMAWACNTNYRSARFEDMRKTERVCSNCDLPIIENQASSAKKKVAKEAAKWKCFFKSVDSAQFAMVAIPCNVDSIKALIFDESAEGVNEYATTLDNIDENWDIDSPISNAGADVDAFLGFSSESKSRSSSRETLMDVTFGPSEKSPDKKTGATRRERAKTWDEMQRRVINTQIMGNDRLRTNSLGTKSNYVKTAKIGCALRPRKYVSMKLPIVIYNCDSKNLYNCLIRKKAPTRSVRINWDSIKNENEDDVIRDSSLNESNQSRTNELESDDPILQAETSSIRNGCFKAIASSLFTSLQLGYHVSAYDVQQSINKCVQSLVVIDITSYLKTVCGHFKSSNTDKDFRINCSRSHPSSDREDYYLLHRLIKKKFVSIVMADFKPIPMKPEFYYCSTSCPKESRPDSPGLNADSDVLGSQELSNPILQEDHENINGKSDESGSSDSYSDSDSIYSDQVRTSLLSNMDSDSSKESLQEISDENFLEDVFPLFLHFVACFSSEMDVKRCSVPVIPTCICDVFERTNEPPDDIRINDWNVKLHVYCLSSQCGNFEKVGAAPQIIHLDDGKVFDQLSGLPDYHRNTLDKCISDIDWLSKDEIATFLLDEYPITVETLKFVCNHVANSISKSTCSFATLPLVFLFHRDRSFHIFLREFSSMKIPNYTVKKVSDYFVLTKEETKTIPRDSSTEQSREECIFSKKRLSSTEKIISWFARREEKRRELPNFWLILKIDKDQVSIYFHSKMMDIDTNVAERYLRVRLSVINSIEDASKLINQRMILQNLHETHICDQLLEADILSEYVDGEGDTELSEYNVTHKFPPGYFACPVVWETTFPLHPRLKSSLVKYGGSRGIVVLGTVLGSFSVNNRQNLYVYQDSKKNVFYMRLYEHVQHKYLESDDLFTSFSRSSSISSLYKRPSVDSQVSLSSGDDNRSLKSKFCGDPTDDHLILRVHGITDAGPEIKTDLARHLENRLDDALLDAISVTLSRNPKCKLITHDVHFIQKPNEPPFVTLKFKTSKRVTYYLDALKGFIRSNILEIARYPKYTDAKAFNNFQDYMEPTDSTMPFDIFLYNQNISFGKSLACIALAITKNDDSHIDCRKASNEPFNEPRTLEECLSWVTVSPIRNSSDYSDDSILVQYRIWKKGKLNLDWLSRTLEKLTNRSLWELVTDIYLLAFPLTRIDDKGVEQLEQVYHKILPLWAAYGNDFETPSVITYDILVPTRHNLDAIVAEFANIFSEKDVENFVYIRSICDQVKYVPYTLNEDKGLYEGDVCILIGRNVSHWKSCIENYEAKFGHDDSTCGVGDSKNFEDYILTTHQKYYSVVVSESRVKISVVGWITTKRDALIKTILKLEVWFQARTRLFISIEQQKMGLFRSQPIFRKGEEIKGIPNVKEMYAKKMLDFATFCSNDTTGPQLNQLVECLKDLKLRKAQKKLLIDESNADDILKDVKYLIQLHEVSTKSVYFLKDLEPPNPLYNLWQIRGCSPETTFPEDLIHSFQRQCRLIHYCMTPLLFLHRWKIQSASTRDYSLTVKPRHQAPPRLSMATSLNYERVEEKWHKNVCLDFANQYKQHLQSLGFVPIQVYVTTTSRSIVEIGRNMRYLQKSLLGGILFFVLSLREPFFCATLYSLEYTRLKPRTPGPMVPQYSVTFIDECDMVKLNGHLHSFAYDYHLRALRQLVVDTKSLLCPGFGITTFLDDFLKYYSKAPNFARNIAQSDTFVVRNIPQEPVNIFKYLIQYGENYDAMPYHMFSGNNIAEESEDTLSGDEQEHVLIKVKTLPSISYKDVNDVRQTDDFDVLVIISYVSQSKEETNGLFSSTLRLHVVIAKQREIYQKVETETKIGKFRTVSKNQVITTNVCEENFEPKVNTIDEPSTKNEANDGCLVQFKQESVNYVGYYSSHEETMQNLICEEFQEAKKYVENTLMKASQDYVTHGLWNRLLGSIQPKLEFSEFESLLVLSDVTDMNEDEEISEMLNQPLSDLNNLTKYLTTKYPNNHILFNSAENKITHMLITHARYDSGFVLFTINVETVQCGLKVVFRRENQIGKRITKSVHKLMEEIVNGLAIALWYDIKLE